MSSSPYPNDPAAGADAPQIHWRQYGAILMERKWIALTTLVVVVTITMISTFKETPIFRTFARIMVDAEQQTIPTDVETAVANEIQEQQTMNTLRQLLTSHKLAKRVVQKHTLDQDREFIPGDGKISVDTAASVLRGCISTQQVPDSRLIDIVAEHSNAAVATRLANLVAEEFVQWNFDEKTLGPKESIRLLDAEVESYKKNYEQSQQRILEYSKNTHGILPEDLYRNITAEYQAVTQRLFEAKSNRLEAEDVWWRVKKAIEEGRNPASIPEIAASPDVTSLRSQYVDRQLNVTRLQDRYKESHPLMVEALSQLQEIQKQLDKAVNDAIRNIELRYVGLKAQEDAILRRIESTDQRLSVLTQKNFEFQKLKFDSEQDQRLYQLLKESIKDLDFQKRVVKNNVSVVDPARLPGAPYKPQRSRSLMMGVVLGVVFGLGLSFLAHFYDDKIKTTEDIEHYLKLPLLTCVPHIQLTGAIERSREVVVEPKSIASESFRTMRANISISPSANKMKLFLITSAGPSEGKSLVASNLAQVFANNSQRTLLIDCDLRHPVQQRVYQSTALSLSTFLANASGGLESVIQKTDIPNLDVITCHSIPPNPPELLGSARMRELLNSVRDRYDRIVVDSPPITVVSDAVLLLPYVEGVILVVHFRKMRRDLVARAVRKLRDGDVPIVGAVLNNIDLKKNGYYYYPYHYHYYGQYAQSNKAQPKQPIAPDTTGHDESRRN